MCILAENKGVPKVTFGMIVLNGEPFTGTSCGGS
jgi:hypothetical protein